MRFFKEKRREKLRSQPFPADWERVLRKNVPLYLRLSEEDRRELHGHVHVFLQEKRFEGCAGLRVTDEIRLTVAAQACLLLLRRPTDYYPGLYSILVYPTTYVAPVVRHDDVGVVSEYEEDRSGETWEQGSLVLSWDDVKSVAAPPPASEDRESARHRSGNGGSRSEGGGGAAIPAPADEPEAATVDAELVPAYNVVLHEFAHQLDLENGELDGIPRLASPERYDSWVRVFDAAYDQLEREWKAGLEPVIDDYALEDEAEFFAVATESFFETPIAILEEYPGVYEELGAYFNQDPARWGRG